MHQKLVWHILLLMAYSDILSMQETTLEGEYFFALPIDNQSKNAFFDSATYTLQTFIEKNFYSILYSLSPYLPRLLYLYCCFPFGDY
jgi:hypothetical protein